MSVEYETERARNNRRSVFFFGVIFTTLALLITCILSFSQLIFQKQARITPTREMRVMGISTAIPTSHFSVRLPFIESHSETATLQLPVTSQIWTVIKIKSLGYESNDQRYDVAVFRRVGSQDTVKTYCIDRGLDTPDLGMEYLLTTDGIFIPLLEPDAHLFQRFLMIQ